LLHIVFIDFQPLFPPLDFLNELQAFCFLNMFGLGCVLDQLVQDVFFKVEKDIHLVAFHVFEHGLLVGEDLHQGGFFFIEVLLLLVFVCFQAFFDETFSLINLMKLECVDFDFVALEFTVLSWGFGLLGLF
jgi:hypothetical protein